MTAMGAVLWRADRDGAAGDAPDSVTVRDALLIGASQALAIVPGVSRSGATISTALFLGYRREDAARFSFLLATPITAGAALVKVPKLLASGATESSPASPPRRSSARASSPARLRPHGTTARLVSLRFRRADRGRLLVRSAGVR
jgi:hypothetical protein